MTQISVLQLFHRPEVSERIALIAGARTYTYGETAAAIDRVAAGLWALGIRKGTRVGIYITNTPQFLQLAFALWRIGAVSVLVDVFNPPARAMELCNLTATTHLVLDEKLVDVVAPYLPELRPGVTLISTGDQVKRPDLLPWTVLSGDHPPAPPGAVADSDLLVLGLSSGTTSRPKAICHTQHNLDSRLRSHLLCPPFTPDDVACPMSPLSTVAGLNACALPALAVGAKVVLFANAGDAIAVLEQIVRDRGTIVMGGPSRLYGLIQAAKERPDLARTSLRFVLTGGDKTPEPQRKAWHETFGVPLLDGFGLTETLGGVLINRLEDPDHAGNVGLPFPGVEVRLLGEDGRNVPDGTPGELWCKADFMFTEYLDEPERTRDALVDGWFRTGDLAVRDPKGRYRILGRRDFVIMRGTVCISPIELETALLKIPAISDCMVSGVPHEQLGQELEAFLVLSEPLTLKDLKTPVIDRLGPTFSPSKFWAVAEIPRTNQGKIDRRAAAKLRADATPIE